MAMMLSKDRRVVRHRCHECNELYDPATCNRCPKCLCLVASRITGVDRVIRGAAVGMSGNTSVFIPDRAYGESTQALQQEITRLKSILSEIQGWAVCHALATDDDMMQNIERITEISGPDFKGHGK